MRMSIAMEGSGFPFWTRMTRRKRFMESAHQYFWLPGRKLEHVSDFFDGGHSRPRCLTEAISAFVSWTILGISTMRRPEHMVMSGGPGSQVAGGFKHDTQSWIGESEQNDKWIFRLTAAMIAAHQERS